MAFSSISNSKLHCCLVILILFILIFFSLPLMLIYLANTRLEQQTLKDRDVQAHSSTSEPDVVNYNCSIAGAAGVEKATINEGHPVQCPEGTFPCTSCPNICVQQNRNCDGNNDCPDKSDETSCYDSSGAMGVMFKNIVDTRNKFPGLTALAKPDSCEWADLLAERCPCNMSEPKVIICDGYNLRAVPNDLLDSVFKIRMSNNSISSLAGVRWPPALTSLVLLHNRIRRLGPRELSLAPHLVKLYLSHNQLEELHEDALEQLVNMNWLLIESNRLSTFSTRLLRHTPAMTKIHLSENQIDLPPDTRFSESPQLKELLLDHNRISAIRRGWFSAMPRLLWLSLTHNEIATIEPGAFDGNYDLQELNLSFNRIKVIDRRIFARRLNIQRLYLSGNPLVTLPVDAFRELLELKSLNLTHIEFHSLERATFAPLRHLEFIYFKKFRFCHYAAEVRVCRPITDGLSSTTELLAFDALKYALWIVALVCSAGNVFVLIWRSVSPHEDRTMSLFIKNLSVADLMMGIYLCTIGLQDWKFQQNFRTNAIEWMSSWQCTAIGFLAILSSELSVFLLTIITVERYRSIVSIRRFEPDAQKRRARLYVALAWLFALLIASYPALQWLRRRPDSYATNGLCLPLHIDQPFTRGWQYSAFVYLVVNFLAVMVIIVLYARMYTMIIDGRQIARPALFKAERHEDAILAIRFFFIVVTDCLSWIPIVVIKWMAVFNVTISDSIYGWLVVFIIPINSALNPIVYTLAAPTTLRSTVCKQFARLCDRLDRLTSGATRAHANGTGSDYSSASSSVAPELLVGHRRRRRKLGSNSISTCDTSIGSQPRESLETSAKAILVHCERAHGTTQAHSKDSSFSSSSSSSNGGSVGGTDSTQLSAVIQLLDSWAPRRPLDSIASYNQHETLTHTLLATEHDHDDEQYDFQPNKSPILAHFSSAFKKNCNEPTAARSSVVQFWP